VKIWNLEPAKLWNQELAERKRTLELETGDIKLFEPHQNLTVGRIRVFWGYHTH
jgi:hypothetical protein